MKSTLLLTSILALTNCEDNIIFLKSNTIPDLKTSSVFTNEIIAAIIIGGFVVLCCIVSLITTARRRVRNQASERIAHHRKASANKGHEIAYNVNKDSVPKVNGNNCELVGESRTTSMIATNRTLGITDKPFLQDKKVIPDNINDMSMSEDGGSVRRKIENQNAEASFKIAISNLDGRGEDKEIRELVTRKMAPQKVGNVRSSAVYSSNSGATKDIIANNIYNYTEGKREDFYTEGSEEQDEDHVERRRGSEDVCQVDFDRKRMSTMEKDMTPAEHSDFLDEDDDEKGVPVEDNYNSVDIKFEKKLNVHVPKPRRKTLLDKL
jgi:hypothetical protein